MKNLTCNYAGIELKNPIVVGANNMVYQLKYLEEMQEAGAAAIVFKTLFEEQIEWEKLKLAKELSQYDNIHAEMATLFPKLEHSGPEEHLMKLYQATSRLSIPIIGSLNCMNIDTWKDYAKQMEDTGIKALELNLSTLPLYDGQSPEDLENEIIRVIEHVADVVSIPITVKIAPFYTNILQLIKRIERSGARGVVLFNRLFQPDVNIDEEKFVFNEYLSSSNDNRLTLRYVGMLYENTSLSLIANTGIHNASDVIKMTLVGADAVQIVSTLYLNKISYIKNILTDLESWMDKKGYNSLTDFKGKLSRKRINDPLAYKRAQYIDILMNSDNLLDVYSMP